METIEYIKNLIKDKNIASITPTSQSAVRDICEKIDFNRRLVLVEYGPATGVFTKYFLDHMTDDSIVIAIELNENFVNYLEEHFDDPRLKVYKESAENVHKIVHQFEVEVDYIVSGIPFSMIPAEVKHTIIKNTHEVLKDGGKFLAYQTFFQKDQHLMDELKNVFSYVEDEYELKNVPPLRVYEAIKNA